MRLGGFQTLGFNPPLPSVFILSVFPHYSGMQYCVKGDSRDSGIGGLSPRAPFCVCLGGQLMAEFGSPNPRSLAPEGVALWGTPGVTVGVVSIVRLRADDR